MSAPTNNRYVIICPAWNEEQHVEKTLRSIAAQTHPPLKFILVSDGSTDRTDEIAAGYARRFPFIELLHREKDTQAKFGSKALAFHAGYERVRGLEYEFIGNLDADVSFEPDYFERLLQSFADEPQLGLAGGNMIQVIDGKRVTRTTSDNSVCGAVHLFRRECFESFGGYRPLKYGGIDSSAEIMARWKGWRVRTVRELEVLHHDRFSTGGKSVWHTRYRKGIINFQLGYHPLYHATVCLFRFKDYPYLLGGGLMFWGYLWCLLRGMKPQLPAEVVCFLRREQLGRLKGILSGRPLEISRVARKPSAR